ncbi:MULTISPECIES: FmdB family zinc ribbon protein [unclassified Polaromonas]|uniref:FmdB family zinc ribbon protein n=1 Tax=unclassified Polaromonas TaxID=2638319 RepID=UPI0018CAB08E|nr:MULTISPECIES: FmdB family zinc ribbon protein [unclassified Polaromonas]MBG6071014.1 putative FmdB family regulatory protein [Polaromonas sp. CG_9.7]MBG6112676.1 putative FmdB family regulatory protein [Polaromonas sp. CG_9.2]MDH6186151.1 putative FmdB family regulatory protein [Polaromonas sp. CG_23.6]
MPIYAYKCESCGFAKDVLQKMSDAPLSVCPQCNAPSFKKQLTAAGFQLKGSGWYVTDFKGGNSGAPAAKSAEAQAAAPADAGNTSSNAGASSGSAASPAATPSATASSPAPSTSNTGNNGAPKKSS